MTIAVLMKKTGQIVTVNQGPNATLSAAEQAKLAHAHLMNPNEMVVIDKETMTVLENYKIAQVGDEFVIQNTLTGEVVGVSNAGGAALEAPVVEAASTSQASELAGTAALSETATSAGAAATAGTSTLAWVGGGLLAAAALGAAAGGGGGGGGGSSHQPDKETPAQPNKPVVTDEPSKPIPAKEPEVETIVNTEGKLNIIGEAKEGGVLKANLTDVDGLPNSGVTYVWKIGNETVAGVTGDTLTLPVQQAGYAGKAVTVTATYTDNHGNVEKVESQAVSVIESVPTITGTVSTEKYVLGGNIGKIDFGLDNGAEKTITVQVANSDTVLVLNPSKDEENLYADTNKTVVLDVNTGTFVYAANDFDPAPVSLTFIVTDSDGDSASRSVALNPAKADIVPLGVEINGETMILTLLLDSSISLSAEAGERVVLWDNAEQKELVVAEKVVDSILPNAYTLSLPKQQVEQFSGLLTIAKTINGVTVYSPLSGDNVYTSLVNTVGIVNNSPMTHTDGHDLWLVSSQEVSVVANDGKETKLMTGEGSDLIGLVTEGSNVASVFAERNSTVSLDSGVGSDFVGIISASEGVARGLLLRDHGIGTLNTGADQDILLIKSIGEQYAFGGVISDSDFSMDTGAADDNVRILVQQGEDVDLSAANSSELELPTPPENPEYVEVSQRVSAVGLWSMNSQMRFDTGDGNDDMRINVAGEHGSYGLLNGNGQSFIGTGAGNDWLEIDARGKEANGLFVSGNKDTHSAVELGEGNDAILITAYGSALVRGVFTSGYSESLIQTGSGNDGVEIKARGESAETPVAAIVTSKEAKTIIETGEGSDVISIAGEVGNDPLGGIGIFSMDNGQTIIRTGEDNDVVFVNSVANSEGAKTVLDGGEGNDSLYISKSVFLATDNAEISHYTLFGSGETVGATNILNFEELHFETVDDKKDGLYSKGEVALYIDTPTAAHNNQTVTVFGESDDKIIWNNPDGWSPGEAQENGLVKYEYHSDDVTTTLFISQSMIPSEGASSVIA